MLSHLHALNNAVHSDWTIPFQLPLAKMSPIFQNPTASQNLFKQNLLKLSNSVGSPFL